MMIPCEIIPSHEFALWIMSHINRLLIALGIPKNPTLDQIFYVTAFVLVGLLFGMLIKKLVLFLVRKFVKVRNSDIARQILQEKLLLRCSHVIPPLVIMGMIPLALNATKLSEWLMKILVVYTIIVIGIALSAVLTFIWNRYNEHDNARNLPLKGILNTAKGILWLVSGIIIVSVLIDKSPGTLLAGLGAFAAALMLIFKDSILGFTAGLQLALNDMVHVGDWIVVPSTPANGTVLDVSLTAVKVQNFDNTIVTCPPYTLVSTSFQNYRGMKESGCRRIARSVIFDFSSVQPITREKAQEIAAKLPLIQDFVAKAGDAPTFNPNQAAVNGTIDTNLGLFRAYMCRYILTHDQFSHTEQILIRVMEPTNAGLPLQIYCFTATTVWTEYEAIQSALFEHIASVAPIFGLQLFNIPSGTDISQIQFIDYDGTPAKLSQGAAAPTPQPK